jgi:hypothetical protein
MDVELAMAEVQAFRDDVRSFDNSEPSFPVGNPYEAPIDRTAELRSQISNRLPIVQAIAMQVDLTEPDRLRDWPYVGRTSGAIAAADELLGFLGGRERLDAILGAQGPNLAAARMHPWVWEAAARLWDGGHRRAAVQQAAAAVFDGYFPAKLRLVKGAKCTDPRSLAGAFNPDSGSPRLRFPDLTEGTQDWTNAHEGAMYLGFACAQALRNIATHGTDEMDEDVALESLAALSLLARWIEVAEVVSAPS